MKTNCSIESFTYGFALSSLIFNFNTLITAVLTNPLGAALVTTATAALFYVYKSKAA